MIETVKKFIKNNSVVLIIVGIGCMFILFNVIGNCRADKHLQQMQPTINRQMIIDSVNNATRAELIKQRDSLIKESEKKLINFMNIKEHYNTKLEFLGFFFNKVLTNTLNFRRYSELIKAEEDASDYFFKSYVRQDMNIEKAKQEGKNIFQISSSSRAAEDYKNLVKEIYMK